MSMAASRSSSEPPLVVVMGVSGSGKSSVGSRLAARLGVAFVEGDALHPAGNVEKMARGVALTDDDRWPWLDRVGEEMARRRGEGVVVSCSALRRAYRDRLRGAVKGLRFVHLAGERPLLEQRLAGRKGHFMPLSLLDSQIATLEPPAPEEGVIGIAVDIGLDGVVAAACAALALEGRAP